MLLIYQLNRVKHKSWGMDSLSINLAEPKKEEFKTSDSSAPTSKGFDFGTVRRLAWMIRLRHWYFCY